MSRTNPAPTENILRLRRQRVADVLSHKGVSYAEADRGLRYSAGYIGKIVRGQQEFSGRFATGFCLWAGVRYRWLMDGEGEMLEPAAGMVKEAEAGYAPLGLLNMPIVGQAAADETAGALRDLESVQSIYRSTAQRGLVKVLGGSMEPLARAGQYAVVDLSDRSAQNGDIVILETTDGRVLAKRYHEQDGRILLSGVNPVRPSAPVSLAPEQISQLRIVIGVLFE